ncbi:sialate O-acetylesterase [Jiulongibacter sediminis]|uniref:Sialate O-acetylesterase domain-containing protein n=1 Tax=Jiulongibacter sediminis TaxID=1605367 RepID=A0A0N8H9M1_9BACT|nr:sialate O-acetylesterase [Jiulongibacter sediminis]KPM47756.1 hypothetical protein AFM12_10810 [Jiulongibacter sediminis]
MKAQGLLFYLLLLSISAKGQIELSGFPADYQLIGRSVETGFGSITFEVSFTDEFQSVKALLYNGPNVVYAETKNYSGSVDSHTFNLPVQAGLQEYDLKVYGFRSSLDSVLVKESKDLVCGDVIVIYGQSNCFGYSSIYRVNPDPRMRTALLGNNNQSLVWDKAINRKYDLGEFGILMGDSLIKQLGVAVCVVNRGASGRNIDYLKQRNENNPFDTGTWYGQTLGLLEMSELLNFTTAFIFRQGESEAMTKYQPVFDSYYGKLEEFISNLKIDLPALKKIYLTQLNVLYSPDFDLFAGSTIREAQRKAGEIENVEVISTHSLQNEFDGAHFSFDGHAHISGWISRLIKEQIHREPLEINIKSESIRRAYFANAIHDSLVLEFEPAQNLVAEPERNGKQIQNYFYLEDGKGIKKVSALGNQVFIELWDPSQSSFISYLPSAVQDIYGYNGPLMKNEAGLAALSFYRFPITEVPLSLPENLQAIFVNGAIHLSWQNTESRNHTLLLEKKINGNLIEEIPLNQNTENYTDGAAQVISGRVYTYELYLVYESVSSARVKVDYHICPSEVEQPSSCVECSLYQSSELHLSEPLNPQKVDYFVPSALLEPGFSTLSNSVFKVEIFQCESE